MRLRAKTTCGRVVGSSCGRLFWFGLLSLVRMPSKTQHLEHSSRIQSVHRILLFDLVSSSWGNFGGGLWELAEPLVCCHNGLWVRSCARVVPLGDRVTPLWQNFRWANNVPYTKYYTVSRLTFLVLLPALQSFPGRFICCIYVLCPNPLHPTLNPRFH
jgi:hypothetical protein